MVLDMHQITSFKIRHVISGFIILSMREGFVALFHYTKLRENIFLIQLFDFTVKMTFFLSIFFCLLTFCDISLMA